MHSDDLKIVALQQAIKQSQGKRALADRLGVTPNHINNWLKRGDCIPYHHTVVIASETGIPLNQLAPYSSSANHRLDTLKAAVFSEKQAEAQAEEIKILIDKKMATKDDLHQLEERMNHRFNGVDHRFKEVDYKIKEMGQKIIITLGSMIAYLVIILAAFIKLV